MSTVTESPSSSAEIPTFFPSKRRKLQLRRRPSDGDSASKPSTSVGTVIQDEETPAIPPILRKPIRQPHLGLRVSTPKPASQTTEPRQDPTVSATEAEVAAVVNRFTHQTGQILDVDKHMMTYIEAEMAKRRGAPPPSEVSENKKQAQTAQQQSAYWAPTRPEGRGATLGKLHEVDLGEEARARNVQLTTEATRQINGGGPAASPPPPEVVPNSRHHHKRRRRRNSQDLERDRLVEEVLRESRLDIYAEENAEENDGSGEEEDGAADDRIAEKFRKEFIDALVSRRRRRFGDANKQKGKKDDKRPKGPKLGGSRMARAAMREKDSGQAAGVQKK